VPRFRQAHSLDGADRERERASRRLRPVLGIREQSVPKKPKINDREMDWLVSKMLENPSALIPRYIPSTGDRRRCKKRGEDRCQGIPRGRDQPRSRRKAKVRDPFLLLRLIWIYNLYEGYLRSWKLGVL
jgi:hypothetical protein